MREATKFRRFTYISVCVCSVSRIDSAQRRLIIQIVGAKSSCFYSWPPIGTNCQKSAVIVICLLAKLCVQSYCFQIVILKNNHCYSLFFFLFFCFKVVLSFVVHRFRFEAIAIRMDDIDAFFNRNKPVVRKTISGGTTNGRIKIDIPKKPTRSDDFAGTSQYAQPHIAENQQRLLEVITAFFLSLCHYLL